MVLGLTRSRLWIGVLGSLLVGIVALNVMALSFNAASSETAGLSDELREANSALRADIADGLSNERLQDAAARIGLVIAPAASACSASQRESCESDVTKLPSLRIVGGVGIFRAVPDVRK